MKLPTKYCPADLTESKTVFWTLVFLLASCCWQPLAAQDEELEKEKPIRQVTEFRIDGPKKLNHGANLVTVQARYKGSNRWRIAEPEEFELTVSGAIELANDISNQPVNPITLVAKTDGACKINVTATVGKAKGQGTFTIERLEAQQTFSVVVDPDQASHKFTGLGAGLMFYDNQFTIDKALFDWCFKDVDTEILHILIRPDFEPVNDNDDWQVLNKDGFDWSACQRLFWICWNARQRNPDIKVYACLYSPPAWMKANDDTTGDAGLKKGDQYPLEMAEYVYAFLKHAEWKGTRIDYLCLFNEPDFPHSQDGNYFESLTDLARTQALVAEKVIQLIDADPDFNHKPEFVFPETLGPGSITRDRKQSPELAKLAKEGLLNHLSAWGVHDYWKTGGDYWTNRFSELREFPGVGERPIWMTEWAQRYSRGDLESSLQYSQNILNAIRSGASVWLAFEWAHPAPNQAGLISTQWGKGFPKKRFWRSKSYYAFRQIANSSPAGGEVLQLQMKLDNKKPDRNVEALAIRKEDRMVVHLFNRKNRPLRYELNIKGEQSATLAAMRTTNATENDSPLDSNTDSTSGELAPYSLLTLEFSLE